MPDQTPNKSCGSCLLEKNWGKGQCKYVREWQSVQGPGFVVPKSCDSETPWYHGHSLTKKDKTAKPEQGRNEKCLGVRRAPLSYGNSWEGKNDCMALPDSSSDSDKLVSPPEADTWKAWAGNNGTASTTSLCSSQLSPRPALLWILHLGCHCKLSAEKGNGRSRL